MPVCPTTTAKEVARHVDFLYKEFVDEAHGLIPERWANKKLQLGRYEPVPRYEYSADIVRYIASAVKVRRLLGVSHHAKGILELVEGQLGKDGRSGGTYQKSGSSLVTRLDSERYLKNQCAGAGVDFETTERPQKGPDKRTKRSTTGEEAERLLCRLML